MQRLEILETLPAPGPGPAGLAWDGAVLWLNDFRTGNLYRQEQRSGRLLEAVQCAGTISGLAWDGQALWQSRLDEPYLQRIHPTRLDIDRTIVLPGYRQLTDVGWDGRTLWVLWQDGSRLLNVDPGDASISREIGVKPAAGPLSCHGDLLWLARAQPMTFDPQSLSFRWTGAERSFLLEAVEPSSGAVRHQFALPFLPTGLAWTGEDLWLSQASAAVLHRARLPVLPG